MTGESTGSGKWTQAGVPHANWRCIDVEDVEKDLETCQMCEAREIRFVHIMDHPIYADRLRVGAICAGHMEQDREGALRREQTFKNVAARRRKWLTRRWRTSINGNEFLRTDGFHVVIFRGSGGWMARLTHVASQYSRPLKVARETRDEAKLAAFDGMVRWKEQQPWTSPPGLYPPSTIVR